MDDYLFMWTLCGQEKIYEEEPGVNGESRKDVPKTIRFQGVYIVERHIVKYIHKRKDT